MTVFHPNMLPEKLQQLTPREQNWLWEWLSGYPDFVTLSRSSPSYDPEVVRQWFLKQSDGEATLQEILTAKANALVRNQHFEWIEKRDQRLLLWLIVKLSFRIGEPGHGGPCVQSFSSIPPDQRHDAIILAFDAWRVHKGKKKQLLSELYTEWGNVKAKDREIRWLDHKNEDQIKWAWNYLERHQAVPAIPTPISTTGQYTSVLSSIDHLAYRGSAEKQLFLDKMRKTWSQKKYRDSQAGKKQRSFFIREDVSEKLNALASKQKLKPAELLEKLVEEACSKS